MPETEQCHYYQLCRWAFHQSVKPLTARQLAVFEK